ncbi:MAG: hypothetical protein WBW53_07675, partial [Terriglobales bacterium]
MLNGGPLDRNRKFGHWAGRRGQVIGSELGHCKSHRFIKRVCLDLDSVRNSLCIGERNAAAGYAHPGIIPRISLFIRLRTESCEFQLRSVTLPMQNPIVVDS